MNSDSGNIMQSENYIICPTCGKAVDKRDAGQVLSHGVWDEETQAYVCYDIDLNVIGEPGKRVE